jgi:hypothetical protein
MSNITKALSTLLTILLISPILLLFLLTFLKVYLLKVIYYMKTIFVSVLVFSHNQCLGTKCSICLFIDTLINNMIDGIPLSFLLLTFDIYPDKKLTWPLDTENVSLKYNITTSKRHN